VYNAFRYTPYHKVKAVILGQDPYHGFGQAHGLCFSQKKSSKLKVPPSLRNIFKELNNDLGYDIPKHGELTKWAEQGVFMLNTLLTVWEGAAFSHSNKGWEIFTDEVIRLLNEREKPMVFILWGSRAEKKEKLITEKRHLILKSVHPSPYSANRDSKFFNKNHFSKTNRFLNENGMEEIDWEIK